jgi:hypothetical protein
LPRIDNRSSGTPTYFDEIVPLHVTLKRRMKPATGQTERTEGSRGTNADDRYGSLTDIEAQLPDVRFTRESRHRRVPSACPLSATSGLTRRSNGRRRYCKKLQIFASS